MTWQNFEAALQGAVSLKRRETCGSRTNKFSYEPSGKCVSV